MKCNICEQEMVKGYIPVQERTLQWIPTEVVAPLWPNNVPKSAKALCKVNFLQRKKKLSYYCHNCEVAIVPVEKGKK